jgi:predicted nucleotide-binding protein
VRDDVMTRPSDVQGIFDCRRRFKSEPPRRSNIEPGVEADFEIVGCG